MIQRIKKLRQVSLFLMALVVIGSNLVNYFYCYIYLDDRLLQWKVAMISIAVALFLLCFYVWLNESLKGKGLTIIVSGWVALYLFFNMIGVFLGYNLHTKGFMIILFLIGFFGLLHLIYRAWQKFI